MKQKMLDYCRSSVRNRLLLSLSLATALFLLFPSILSIFALRKQLLDFVEAAGQITVPIQDLLVTQTITLVLISLMAIAALAVLVSLIAYGITHPIKELAEETEKMAQGKRALKPLPFEGEDEVGTLAKGINHFMTTIQTMEKEKEKDAALAAIGRMSAELAHEIRNPIGSVDIFCQLFSEKWRDESFREKFSKTVPYELSRIKILVNQLLEVARPINLTFRNVDAKQILMKTVSEYQNGKYPGLKLQLDIPEGDWKIVADEFALVRVFKNLVQNAVQAMKQRGALTISLKKVENRVELVVQDTGPGINEEALEKIFEPFFTSKAGGTGLGLAICKKIIAGHGGHIYAESRVGRGTTFLVQIPLKPTGNFY